MRRRLMPATWNPRDWEQYVPNQAMVDGPGSPADDGLCAIVFTDIEGPTQVSSTRGDDAAMAMVHPERRHPCLAC